MNFPRNALLPGCGVGVWLLSSCAFHVAPVQQTVAPDIDTVVVIYAENHSFDNMYGLFPGAEGIAQATAAQKLQLDHDGKPLKELVVFGHDGKPDPKYPRMPNAPFRIDAPPVSRPPNTIVHSPIHAFYQNQEQINGGQNNLFAAMSNVGGWVMGHYDGSQFRMWKWAQEYTLADHFFMASYGGSYLNHQWLICACTPKFDDAPQAMRVQLDANGKLAKKPAYGFTDRSSRVPDAVTCMIGKVRQRMPCVRIGGSFKRIQLIGHAAEGLVCLEIGRAHV